MRLLPLLAVCLVSCVAGGESAEGPPLVGEAEAEVTRKPGPQEQVHQGRCGDACWMVAIGACDWKSDCYYEVYGPPIVICAGVNLYCDAAQEAAEDGASGMEYCWRDCENLK